MKKQFQLLFILVLLISLGGCRKKKNEVAALKPAENAMSKILENPQYNLGLVDLTTSAEQGGEFGFLFSTLASGKITQLGCVMPEVGVYTVSLWDVNTTKLVRQKTIEQTAPGKLAYANIEALPVARDKQFIVSINTFVNGKPKKLHRLDDKNGLYTQIPKTVGNVLIIAPRFKFKVSTPEYIFNDPKDMITDKLFLGLPDFTLIPD